MAINFGVKRRKNEDINRLLKRYKKWYSEFGIRQELMERKEYKKPTTIKRKQRQVAIREQQLLDKQYKEDNGLR